MNRIFHAFLLATLTTSGYAGGHLLIFSGGNHDVFLGCLTCNETDPASVHNSVGIYGSEVGPNSVLNDVGRYGSDVSPTSACNTLAFDPPIVVDEDGNYFGLLSVNDMKPGRITDEAVLRWLYGVACR
jgi:hypothetical protein